MDREKFQQSLRRVLESEKERCDKVLTDDDIDGLLCDDNNHIENIRTTIRGYPTYPLYRELTEMLLVWVSMRRCPTLDLLNFNLLDETDMESRNVRIESAKILLNGLASFWDIWTDGEIDFRIREILLALGKRGLMDLLGVRQTFSTMEVWPPSRQTLIDTFTDNHTAGVTLSVGARALAKHCHRDESSNWWGLCSGSDEKKNEHALSVVNNILDGASWINIHQIVHGVQLLEVRQEKGYGARWTADGESFRGFLEPQMSDGHDIGWKH